MRVSNEKVGGTLAIDLSAKLPAETIRVHVRTTEIDNILFT